VQCEGGGWPTLPHPGTSSPSMGRGISMDLTMPYLLHSSRTSSTISSYSSSSTSSSGVIMFIRHKISVGIPAIWTCVDTNPGTCSVTGVWFIVFWAKTEGGWGGGVMGEPLDSQNSRQCNIRAGVGHSVSLASYLPSPPIQWLI